MKRLSVTDGLKKMRELNYLDYAIYFVLLTLIIVYAVMSPNFLTSRNLFSMLINGNHLLIISLGMAFVILVGKIDLSVGSISYVAMVIAGTLMRDVGFPPLTGFIVCLMVGFCIGLANGLLIIKFKLNSMLVTMGMMIALRGVGHQITQSLVIELSEEVQAPIIATIGGFPLMIILAVLLTLGTQMVFSFTTFGKYAVAIGCHETAAKNIGINTDRINLNVFIISGIFAAMAGYYNAANLGTCLQTMGNGWEFQAISIAVLGGISLSGGTGNTFPGVFIAFLIIVIVENGLALLGATPYLLPIIRGLVIFIAMFADSLRMRKKHLSFAA